MQTILNMALGGLIGGVLASADITPAMWQFWVVMISAASMQLTHLFDE